MLRMKIARTGRSMKTLFLISALGAFAQTALAAEPNCRGIESTGARLSCYDAAFPPKLKKPELKKPGSTNIDGAVDATPVYKDPFLEEEARTTSKLKNICRGC
jgi:hypothetical protein